MQQLIFVHCQKSDVKMQFCTFFSFMCLFSVADVSLAYYIENVMKPQKLEMLANGKVYINIISGTKI